MTAALILLKFIGRWLLARWPYVLGAIAAVLALWWAYSAIYDSGVSAERNRWEARQRAAEAKAQADSWALVGNINDIDTSTLKVVEKIREVSRDKPRTVAIEVARDMPCVRFPDRLLDATNQYTRDLAAAAGYRIEPVSAPAGTGQR